MPRLPPEIDPELRAHSKRFLWDDPKLSSGKIVAFQYLTAAVFVFLVSGFWKLQIQEPEIYSERAERNRVRSLPVLAPRGKILDRDGRVIVDNRFSFSLFLSRENLKMEHLPGIAQGLNLDYNELKARVDRFAKRPKYEPVVAKEELTPGELAFVESHRDSDFFPEMEVLHEQRRLYPQNGFAAHLLGYTGEVSDAELDTADFAKYNPGDIVGKSGLERFYNDQLMGIDGQRRAVVDNRGRERQVLSMKPAVPGKNLQLTIDLDLQTVAELSLEGQKGAVVALNPRNGEVLAMASRPAFDLNRFAVRIRRTDWQELLNNPDKPLLNRASQGQLAPGSTFKPIVALAALESGTIDETFSAQCSGGATFYGHYHKCHLKQGHGTVTLHKGMVQSCDVYFYNVGNRLGIDKMAFYAEQAGLGRKTGIDLPSEAEGIVPSTRWKVRTYREKWYLGETISVAIGQGALTVTPLQLAYAIGGIAMGGVWHQPHLAVGARVSKPREWALAAENVEKVMSGMYGVVNEGGTGARAQIPGIEICGKTGSAQVASIEAAKNAKSNPALKDNAWFVGVASWHEPEIVVVALLEGGLHGYNATPAVRDVIKAYYDKKARSSPTPVKLAMAPAPQLHGLFQGGARE